jgi:glyceraldehyde-3-phosphate dehydrogenase/erythrose-4-phosphate dehydrogenase
MNKGSGDTVVKFGVVGYGYWGPNVVRNLDQLDGSAVVAVCDKSPTARKRIHKTYPHIKVVAETAELVSSPEIDAVAIVTPVWTHYEFTKAALENGKHVFVEKPFTSDSAQAEELINLAAKKNLQIMVYDKGVHITSREGLYSLLVNYRSGDMWAPQVEQIEALRQELAYFIDCISRRTQRDFL